jgi:chromosome segregation ATPase
VFLAAGVAGSAASADRNLPSEEGYESWVERLNQARAEVEEARRDLQGAEAALRNQRQRRYPRGEAKRDLASEVEEARLGLEKAERAVPELLEQARRAGVPPGVLRSDEAF